MIKTLTKIGNSSCLVFDARLRQLTGLKAGDRIDVSVQEDGIIVIVPARKDRSGAEISALVKRTVENYRRTLRKLA